MTLLPRPSGTQHFRRYPTQKLERIADELGSLTKLERHDYAILVRHKLGLNRYGPWVLGKIGPSSPYGAAAGAASGQGTAGSADEKPAAEKVIFDVKLKKFDGDARVRVIKEVRAFTPGLTMVAAKDLIDTKKEADDIVKML